MFIKYDLFLFHFFHMSSYFSVCKFIYMFFKERMDKRGGLKRLALTFSHGIYEEKISCPLLVSWLWPSFISHLTQKIKNKKSISKYQYNKTLTLMGGGACPSLFLWEWVTSLTLVLHSQPCHMHSCCNRIDGCSENSSFASHCITTISKYEQIEWTLIGRICFFYSNNGSILFFLFLFFRQVYVHTS
jgi:hypothetical protein